MKLPRAYFNNLTASKYREYLKLLPDIQKENTRAVVTLIFTFFAMSFFGIFAINPTLSTIVTLKKQLADSQLVHDNLKTKISNLSALQQQYTQLSTDLPTVFEAIPEDARATSLLGQIMGLAKEKRVVILSLGTSRINLLGETQNPTTPTTGTADPGTTGEGSSGEGAIVAPGTTTGQPGAELPQPDNAMTDESAKLSYTFSVRAQGAYEDLIAYAKSLTQLGRIISVESISISKDPKENVLVLDIEGRAYYQK